jgi:glycosyltransferase involved in cell wall biosynthesis
MNVSVVIPSIGKRPEFLTEAIQSILAQTMLPKEIVLVMTGESQHEVNLSSNIPIVTIRNLKILPVSEARNLGALNSKYDILAFLDDDDKWDAAYLEKITQSLRAESFDCVLGRVCKQTLEGMEPLKLNSKLPTLNDLFHYNPGITGSSIVIKKDVFFNIGGFNTKLTVSQDKALIIELLKSNISIGWVNEAIVIHRIHHGERLTNGFSLIKGLTEFLNFYSNEMTSSQISWIKRRITSLKYQMEPNFINLFWRIISIIRSFRH